MHAFRVYVPSASMPGPRPDTRSRTVPLDFGRRFWTHRTLGGGFSLVDRLSNGVAFDHRVSGVALATVFLDDFDRPRRPRRRGRLRCWARISVYDAPECDVSCLSKRFERARELALLRFRCKKAGGEVFRVGGHFAAYEASWADRR